MNPMQDNELFNRNENETVFQYINRICSYHKRGEFSWDDVKDVLNANLGYSHSESYYRKNYASNGFEELEKASNEIARSEFGERTTDDVDIPHVMYDASGTICDICEDGCLKAEVADSDVADDPVEAQIRKLHYERVRLSDERTQNNAYVRRLAREDTLKEIALEIAEKISAKKVLPHYDAPAVNMRVQNRDAILCISDWHYGIEINNYWNVFNPEMCVARVSQLENETIEYCKQNNVQNLHVVNLADLIAGRIHTQIRIQSRYDVITQIEHISEIVAELLNDLSEHFQVHYYDCLDNHSRLEPNKNESMDIESLARITTWYLKSRLKSTNVKIHDNTYGLDIINLNVRGHEIIGVHGDKDKPLTVAKKLTLNTRKQYDMVLTAHRHHFSADEDNECLIISNGTLMGTDDYATSLRLNSKPSQNLIIVSDDNVAECIYRIILH